MTGLTTDRNRNIVSGAIGMLLLVAATTVGIKGAFGAFSDGYEIQGSFAAAGQGLIANSDVKVRGIDIGKVERIELVENRALITMRIDPGREIPVDARAVIRPKTLFGEKFVDIIPGENELEGPFLHDAPVGEDCPSDDVPCLTDTLGGFELEQVLADTHPILEAIDPVELAIVLDELATAGNGLGESINRSIVNGATLSELAASNDAEFRQFSSDLALLAEELDRLAPELLRGADNLNAALPSLNDRSDRLNEALVQLARLTGDVADLLENNTEFTENALTNGSKTLQLLFDKRSRIQPTLLGIEQYTSTLAQAIRVEAADGTMMAAVKNLLSVSEILGTSASEELGADTSGNAAAPTTTRPPILDELDDLTDATTDATTGSSRNLLDILLGGDRG